MDLDAAADELYGGSPDDFVERRKALVSQARRAKERDLARQIGELRRPTRTAWLVNLLAREQPEQVAALLEVGTALEDAQRRGDGAALRSLSQDRRRLVDRLARAAVALGADHGYTAPDAALQEVGQSLQSALADETARDQLRTGRLATAVTYGGFGPTDLMAALAASLPAAAPAPDRLTVVPEPEPDLESAPEPTRKPEPEPEPEPQAEVTPEVPPQPEPEPEAGLQPEPDPEPEPEPEPEPDRQTESREALARAEREAEEATARADALADRVEELRAELADAEEAEVVARTEARAARKRLQEQRRAVSG